MASEVDSAGGPGGYSRKLARNSAYNLGGAGWSMLLTFVSMPYIVHRLGAERFGLLTLVFLVAGYFTFLDLGLGTAIIKYLAEDLEGEGGEKRAGRMVGTVLTANGVMGMAGAVTIALGASKLTGWIGVGEAMRPLAVHAFHVCALIFFINMIAAVFLAIPQSRQRFDLFNIVRVAVQTLQTGGMVVLLAMGWGLREILWLFLGASVVSLMYYAVFSRRLLLGTSFAPVFDVAIFRSLFSFGFYNTVSKVAAILTNQLDRFLIGALMTVGWVTYYAAAVTPAGWIYRIATLVAPVILPAASALDSAGDVERLKRLLLQGSRYVLIFCLPPAVLLMALPGEVLRAWMGPEFAVRAGMPMLLLAAGSLCQGMASVPSMVLMGMGYPRLYALVTLAAGTGSTLLCVVLIPRIGITGAGAAFAVAMGAMLLPLLAYSCVKIRCKPSELLNKGIGRPLAAGVLNFGVLWVARSYASSGPGLLVLAVAGGVVYVGGLFVFRAIDATDIRLFKSFLPGREG